MSTSSAETAKLPALRELARQTRGVLDTVTETDTLERARVRVQLTFDMFYDDEPSEPDQAIRDALTDLMHEAAARGVDFEDAVSRAVWMWRQEREDWGLDDE